MQQNNRTYYFKVDKTVMKKVIKYLNKMCSHTPYAYYSLGYNDFYYGTKNITHDDGKFYFWMDGYDPREIKSRIGAAAVIKLARLL